MSDSVQRAERADLTSARVARKLQRLGHSGPEPHGLLGEDVACRIQEPELDRTGARTGRDGATLGFRRGIEGDDQARSLTAEDSEHPEAGRFRLRIECARRRSNGAQHEGRQHEA
jgi:hypothetical protein